MFETWRGDPIGHSKGGVVVLHAVYGLTDHIGWVCSLWASAGYKAVAPDLFHRAGVGIIHPYSRAGADAGITHYAALSKANILMDIEACASVCRSGGGVAISGFCTGGTWAWRAAALLDFQAQVNFYGSHVADYLDQQPRCPTIMHYGDSDEIMPLDLVQRIMQRRPEVEIHIYPGAGHAFFNPEQTHPNPDASSLAWQRSIAFLDTHVARVDRL